MRMRTKLEPRVSPKLKQKSVLIYAASGLAVATIVGVIAFFALNLGNNEEAIAGNYSTMRNGAWDNNSTWIGGSSPNNWGNHDITLNHNITSAPKNIKGLSSITGAAGKTFTSSGSLTFQQIDNITLDGTMTINGNFTQSGAGVLRITSGDLIVHGDLNIRDITLIIEDGELIVDGDAEFSNNSSLDIQGGDGNVEIGGDLDVKNGSDINFSSTGDFNVAGDLDTYGGGTKEININSGALNVAGDIDMVSASELNIADGASLSADNLYTGNNGDAVVNLDGDANIVQDVDLGGVMQIGETGNMVVGNDYTMRNSGTTITDIGGKLEILNDLNIIGKDLTGTGILDWKGDLNLNGYNAAINGQKNGIPPPPLDLALMETTTLPVELVSFNAEKTGSSVLVTWQTATELNNDFFTIERSSNGMDFKPIGKVGGKGTTNAKTSYEYKDNSPLNGLSYYRLKQTDFDGTTETFRPVSVEMEVQLANEIKIYPNPLLGSTLKLSMENPEEGVVEIYNQDAMKVFTNELDGFDREEEMHLPEGLQPGIYFVHVKTHHTKKTFKLLKR